MKKPQLTTLTLSMLALFGTCATANQFIEDATVSVDVNSRYESRDMNDDSAEQKNLGLGLGVHFESGMAMDRFSVDASLYHAFSIMGDEMESDVGMFPIENNDAEAFGKTAYTLKAKVTDELMLKYGRMIIDTPLLKNHIELLPSLTQGLKVDYNTDNMSLYGIYVDEYSAANQSGFDDLGVSEVNSDTSADEVQIIGGHFDARGTMFNIAYGMQNDYANQFYGDVERMIPLMQGDIHLGAQFGNKVADGQLKDDYLTNDDDVSFYGFKAAYDMNKVMLGFSMVSVDGKRDDANSWGDLNGADTSWQGMWQEEDFVGYNTSLISEFASAGQTSYQFKVGYDLSHVVDGLSTSVSYTMSDVERNTGGDGDEDEINFNINYDIPQIDNLSFMYAYGENTSQHNPSEDEMKQTDHVVGLKWSMPLY